MNKILFLDIDGVLNSMPDKNILSQWKKIYTQKELDHKLYGFDIELVKLLKLIIDRTNCKIVFSTSWRYFKDHHIEGCDWRNNLTNLLNVSDDIFIGDTPIISDYENKNRRGNEINQWISTHTDIAIPENYRFCIIDDEISDIISVINENHIVHTFYKTGIQIKDVDRAVKILNGN